MDEIVAVLDRADFAEPDPIGLPLDKRVPAPVD
jgi:hypothetical protein